MPDRVEVGFVARAHGIRGEVCAITHDPASETFAEAEAVWIKGERYPIVAARPTPKGWLLQLEGVDDRDAADRLRGAKVLVDRDQLALEDGEILLTDLIGCAVRRLDGTPWGTVVAIEGEQQLRLVIHDGGISRELPLVDELVPKIDLEARVVTVDPPEGLPEEPIS